MCSFLKPSWPLSVRDYLNPLFSNHVILLISRALSENYTQLNKLAHLASKSYYLAGSAFLCAEPYHSIYVQIARIVGGEIGCYCGAWDLIDLSVFSIMRPPAAISSKSETSLLYQVAELIQYTQKH